MRETGTIVGLQVIGTSDGKLIGHVSEVVCDLATGEVVGLIVGEGPAEKGIMASEIMTIGTDAVMVPSASAAVRLSELPELMKRRREPERGPLMVVTDDGRRLGKVARVWIDPEAKKVTRYEVSAGLMKDLAEGPLTLPVVPGSVHGEDTLILPAAEVELLAAHSGGLRAKLDELAKRVREQASAAGEQVEEAAKAAEAKIGKAVEAVREQVVSAVQGEEEAGEEEEDRTEAEEAERTEEEQGEAEGEGEEEGGGEVAEEAEGEEASCEGRQEEPPAPTGGEEATNS